MKKVIVFLTLLSLVPFQTFALNTNTSQQDKRDIIIETSRPTVWIPELEKLMDTYIASQVKIFNDSIADMKKDLPNFDFTPSLYIDYQILANDKRLVSVKLNGYMFTGWAHGMPTSKTFVYIPAKKKLLTINSTKFFEKMGKIAIPYFTKKLASTGGDSKQWIKDWLAPKIENWSNFTLQFDEKGKLTLTFYFEPYQIAAYAYWEQSITIDGKGKIVEPVEKAAEVVPSEDY